MSIEERAEWAKVSLGSIIRLEYGRALASSVRKAGDIPVYGSNGVCGKHSTALVNARGIIVGRKGTAGSVTVTSGPFWPIDTTYYVVPRTEVDFDWLRATLEHARLTDLSEATGVPGLNRDKAYLQSIVLPPLDAQRKIAEVLRCLDDALGATEQSVVAYERLLAALRADLTHDADAPPDGVESILLSDLCRPRQHPTISAKQLTDSGYRVFGANGQIGFYTSYTHENPVVAITCRGATCGTINWIPAQSYLTGNAMALDGVQRDIIDERFLFHYLSSWGVAKSIAGSAQPQITRQSLSGIRVAVPRMTEQQTIATLLDGVLAQLQEATSARSTWLALRSQVTADLLTGRVRVPA